MALTPLQDIVQLKPRPETTLALETSIQAGVHTVQGYRFTPSLRDYFREMFELVVSERGQGYWIQAEYGAGKTHLLGTLGVLLTDSTGDAWDAVTDPEIRSFKAAFVGKMRLFPVVLNCKGRLATQGSASSLQRVIERAIDDALGRAGLRGKVTVGTADEIREWWERASPGVRADITQHVKSRFAGHPTPEDLLNTKGTETFATAIIDAAQAVHIEIPYTRDIRARFQHIYRQLTTQHGYHGMVVIIDEFKSWQELHAAGSQEYVEDEHVLETLAFHLPVDDQARIITIVGSQSGPAIKMLGGSQGDRFRTFSLFASDRSAREYDEIVAFRVRELRSERVPDVDQYYGYYFEHFTFLAHTRREYFRDVFPFQPRCFEVIRNITKRELATARSSIHYIHEVLSGQDVLARAGLIKVADLLRSENLVRDLNTTVYKEAYASYHAAYEALPELFEEEGDQRLAGDVLKTLFLWYCAFPEAHRGLTAHDLAEACLAEDETITQEDLIHTIILQRLRALSQVEYTNKERGAFFRVSAVSGPTYTEILARHQRRVDDDREVPQQWLSLLLEPPSRTDGIAMLFAGQTLDRHEKVMGRANKVRYEGDRIVVEHWSRSWGGPVVDHTDYAQHFQLVYMREPVSVAADDLTDDRATVIIPAPWKDVARNEMRRYCAILRIEKEYAGQQGPDVEEIRRANEAKKREILLEIQRKQHEAYRLGRIVTRAGLGIDPNQVFAVPDRADDLIASALLAHAYRQPPFDHETFKRELSATELGRVFAVLFQDASVTADVGAVDNFGRGLGFVSEAKPREFDPVHCPFFDVIRTELAQTEGDINLHTFYEQYTGTPYGVPVDLLSLYLLAFVRFAQPACHLALKPEASFTLKTGRRPRDNRLGFTDVPLVTWQRRLHKIFDRLVQVQGPGWNDFVEYFRELDETLQATTAQEQVIAQQERLGKVFADWSHKVEAIRTRLVGLARNLEQDISAQVAILDTLSAVCQTNPHDLQTFADIFAEQFERDGQKFKEAVVTCRRLEELDRIYVQPLSEAVGYLEHIEGLPQGDPLVDERARVRSLFDLRAFCMAPNEAEKALQAFRQFCDAYRIRYKQHYRDYRSTMASLNASLKALEPCVEGLTCMNAVAELGTPIGRYVVDAYRRLLKRTETAHFHEGLPDVDKRPVVNGIHLDMEPPTADVDQFRKELDETLFERLDLLSTPAIWDILKDTTDSDTQTLVAAVDDGDSVRTASAFTEAVVGKIKALFREARMLIVDVRLADYGPVQVSDASDDLQHAVQGFEQFLRVRLEEAQRSNPGKIVRLNLK